jgi:transposase
MGMAVFHLSIPLGFQQGTNPLHYSLDSIILERDYIPAYLPPYSPELNPIELFWKVLKDRVKGGKLTDIETLSSRGLRVVGMFLLSIWKILFNIL